jgi:hypothetical protein
LSYVMMHIWKCKILKFDNHVMLYTVIFVLI